MAVGTCIRQYRVHIIWDEVFFRNCVGVIITGISFWMDKLNDNQ